MITHPGPIEFELTTPLDSDTIAGHEVHALGLGMAEVDDAPRRTLNIVANGPTARGLTFHGETLALNGALKLFTDRGTYPTYWAACDPQELVTDFLIEAPMQTIYWVASKCHPKVFDRLLYRDARLWHIGDHPDLRSVPTACSVTLCAMMLAHRLGYRRLDLWGWDCCFARDGTHHAATGELGATPQMIDVTVGDPVTGKEFKTTPTWACEAQDAANILPVLKWCGTEIRIHGDSMVAAIIEEFAAEPLFKVA